MNSNSHPHMRYVPTRSVEPVALGVADNRNPRTANISTPAILDRQSGRTFVRSDYTATELQETVSWLNDRHQGYAPRSGAVRTPAPVHRGSWMD